MAAAFTRAGFDAYDDAYVRPDGRPRPPCRLQNAGGVRRLQLWRRTRGAGEGWAKSILFHPALRPIVPAFFADPNTLTLGVCNGCQMVSNLAEIIRAQKHGRSSDAT